MREWGLVFLFGSIAFVRMLTHGGSVLERCAGRPTVTQLIHSKT